MTTRPAALASARALLSCFEADYVTEFARLLAAAKTVDLLDISSRAPSAAQEEAAPNALTLQAGIGSKT